jgi:hypothetical protein
LEIPKITKGYKLLVKLPTDANLDLSVSGGMNRLDIFKCDALIPYKPGRTSLRLGDSLDTYSLAVVQDQGYTRIMRTPRPFWPGASPAPETLRGDMHHGTAVACQICF